MLFRSEGVARVAEIGRMLGGEKLSGMAHAQALLGPAVSDGKAAKAGKTIKESK